MKFQIKLVILSAIIVLFGKCGRRANNIQHPDRTTKDRLEFPKSDDTPTPPDPVDPRISSEGDAEAGLVVKTIQADCVTQIFNVEAGLRTTLSLQPSCPGSTSETRVIQQERKKVDIVFVVDVTKSMQENIEAIKENLVYFSSKLIAKGWDATFAGTTFRDVPGSTTHPDDPNYELLYRTVFMTAEQLTADIRSEKNEWIADDLSDYQEGGQYAIQGAIDLLQKYGRNDAERVILYISDAPAYKGVDHWDFTIDALGAEIAALPGLRFYHSTLNESVSKYANLIEDARWNGPTEFHIANHQMEALLTKSGQKGKGLTFPLTGNVLLDEFAEQFDKKEEVDRECFLIGASLTDQRGLVISQYSEPDFSQAFQKRKQSSILLNSSAPLSLEGKYNVKERRCCVAIDLEIFDRCAETVEREFTIGVDVEVKVNG